MAHPPPENPTALYDHPQWYDILHTPGTARDVTILERIAREHGPKRGRRWLEPACGTGRYLRVLAKRGYRVTGYDLNSKSVQYAERRCRAANLSACAVHGDMTTFCEPNTYHVALNTINTFRHLLDEKDAQAHLECIARSLKPGGIYLLGIDLVDYVLSGPEEDYWDATRGSCTVSQIMMALAPDRETQTERIINHLSVETPLQTHAFQSCYDLRTYDHAQFVRLIDDSPFRVKACYNFEGDPVELNIAARDIIAVLTVR